MNLSGVGGSSVVSSNAPSSQVSSNAPSSEKSKSESSTSSNVGPCANVTASSVSATIGDQSKSSSSKSLDFGDNPPAVIPRKAGVFNLQIDGLQPNTPETRARIKWSVRRNPNDVLTGSNPVLTVDPSDPLKASLTTDAQGSFNIIVYCDPTGSGNWQSGKVLVVFNLVIVAATVQQSSVSPDSSHFSVEDDSVVAFRSGIAGNPPTPAISFSARVLLQGGGSDAKLGLNAVSLGWIGNALDDGFTAYYPSNCTLTMRLKPPAMYPIVDSIDGGSGGSTPFRGSSKSTPVTPPPANGLAFDVTALDLPVEGCQRNYPNTQNHVNSTDGTTRFTDFLSCFSSDFNKSYSILGKVNWSVLWKFIYNTAWQNNGSTVNGPTAVTVTGFPLSATDAGAVVLGPGFGESLDYYYHCD